MVRGMESHIGLCVVHAKRLAKDQRRECGHLCILEDKSQAQEAEGAALHPDWKELVGQPSLCVAEQTADCGEGQEM